MYHYCIFEIDKKTKESKFIDDFEDDWNNAYEKCESMNNKRTYDMPMLYCVRCLTQEEFDNKDSFDAYGEMMQIIIPLF